MDPDKPILTLIVQAALILALSRVMGWIFARLRQPQVVGEMAAGIMLGPSLLGWLAPAVHHSIFPEQSIHLLYMLAQLGVVFFLFLIGLEFDPNLIRRRGRSALLISASSIVLPFAIGVALTHYLYPRVFDGADNGNFTAAALFMGAAISVTAFPVLARIISERNLHKTPVGAISITGAAVNDVLAWCMLAVVVAVAQFDRRESRWAPLITLGLAVAYVAVMFLLVRPSLRRLQRYYDTRGQLSQNILAVIFLLVLASAFATERIGIHALFGAFLLGLIMPKGSKFVRELSDKLEDFTVVFMLPIFFAYAGLSTDLRQIIKPELMGYTALIVLAACAGKIGGTAGAARICGVGWRESAALGVLMNTRGLMELIILTIGLQQQIINEKVYAMMVVMALVTTALTTPLLHWIYPAERFGGAEAAAKATRARGGYTILVPLSLPQSGPALARLAAALVGVGKVVALHLRRPREAEAYRGGLDDAADAASDPVFAPMLAEAVRVRVNIEPISFVTREVADDIADVARARAVDLILMGFHQPVIGKAILGGVVHRVLSEVQTDVAILVDRGIEEARHILVPYMGSPHDRLALELASRMAGSMKAQVTVLHIIDPAGNRPRLGAKGAVERVFQDPSQPAPVTFRVVEDPSPVDLVLREAQQFDLLVIGMDEEWGLESRLIGLRPERIAREHMGSLLIVRHFAKARQASAASASIAEPAPIARV
jgi:Kef-type K+ transport system membrane component KefB/nucleotide-binding universal stress UspA family protein